MSRTLVGLVLGLCGIMTTVQSQSLAPALTGLPASGASPAVGTGSSLPAASPASAIGPPVPAASPSNTAATAGPSMRGSARDTRWDASFAAFDEEDKKNRPTPGGAVFVGSSSIRLWPGIQDDFKGMPVLYKRGFGGSRMLDCANYLQRLVLPYKPRLVVVYAGDNDLAEGRQPADVLKSFAAFFDGVRAELPETRIAYISIKPSPARAGMLDAVREANAMIQAFVAQRERADYIDIFTPMMGPSGQPRAELFASDALHMNAAGYELWTRVILEKLQPDAGETSAAQGAPDRAKPPL